jgi:putative transposase
VRVAVFDYIEIFYNATRRHSTLGMLSPSEYEQATINNNLENNRNS